jgi:hypothetical protein
MRCLYTRELVPSNKGSTNPCVGHTGRDRYWDGSGTAARVVADAEGSPGAPGGERQLRLSVAEGGGVRGGGRSNTNSPTTHLPYRTLRCEWMMRLASSGVSSSRLGLSCASDIGQESLCATGARWVRDCARFSLCATTREGKGTVMALNLRASNCRGAMGRSRAGAAAVQSGRQPGVDPHFRLPTSLGAVDSGLKRGYGRP